MMQKNYAYPPDPETFQPVIPVLLRRRQVGIASLRALLSYISLLKPRIIALLLFVSLVAAFLAAKEMSRTAPLALLLLSGVMAAGGSGALNQYLERDLDLIMHRTRHRPLVTGQISRPWTALAFGLALIILSLAIVVPANDWQALFLLAGALIYVVVYTIWLKRRSPLNVVIGGAAGSCAILAGWASVGAWWTPQPLLMALLIFLWTPPHFWSLAIFRSSDYMRARVPMLPAVIGPRAAARWGLAHVLLVVAVSLVLAFVGGFGPLYLSIAIVAGALLLATALLLVFRPDGARARLHFWASILYLAVVYGAMLVDVYSFRY